MRSLAADVHVGRSDGFCSTGTSAIGLNYRGEIDDSLFEL